MIIGLINTTLSLPQISPEDLSDPAFLRPFSLVPAEEPPMVVIRSVSHQERLAHLFDDCKSAIDALCPDHQSVDHVDNELFILSCPGDVIITSSLLNFSRNLEQALKVVRFFYVKRVRVIAYLENFDSFSPLSIMEDAFYLKFQETRAAEARNTRRKYWKGIYGEEVGRRAFSVDDFPAFPSLYRSWKKKKITKKEFASQLAISRPTLSKLIRSYEAQRKEELK